jgi:hypothetical protein
MSWQVYTAAGNLKTSQAASAMVQLYDNIASGAIASWDVTGISQLYNHLKVVWMGRGDNAAEQSVLMRFNNDTGANYLWQQDIGSAAVASAANNAAATSIATNSTVVQAVGATAGRAGMAEWLIASYKDTTFNKDVTGIAYGPSSQNVSTHGGMWSNTAAINRITILPGAGNFVTGSRLTIYGLL